jgi:carboxyl-terminal processing protease
MTRSARRILYVALSLAAAFGVERVLFSRAEAEPGALAVHDKEAPATDADDANYPLESLPVFSRVIHYVSENYVEPKRIDPKAMVVASLDMIEKTVAEVMVEGDAQSGHLTLTVGSASRPIDLTGVDSIFKVRTVLGEAVAFIQKHLVAHKNLREIEYAATNGMLSTLDPHSILLEPKMFREMRLQTKGEFGGLGFVIAMRDGNLTVVRVIKNTPAQKAGIKAKDVITKIGEQSTVNMDLEDAVDHLRGRPATRVAITVQRTSWPEAKRLDLTREIINVETVPQTKLLAGNIGYVKLSQFSANTTRDLQAAIAQERSQAGGQLKGLVLDLRGNPGGLLEQAISVSDVFLSEGVIVKTVGEGMKLHEVKEAHPDRDDQVSLPLIVIVNNGSASASEIVAGALKNNNRALVIGRQTFGKGSVQVLYDFSDPGRPSEESALKLTIAQYLTPGDVSIQEVGVTPDVLLLPGRVLKDAVNYFAPPRSLGEVDLDKHFSNPADAQLSQAELEKRAQERRNRTEKAPLELRYLLDEKEDQVAKAMKADEKREAQARAHDESGAVDELTPEQQEDEDAEANPDELVEDYQIRFARDLLARAPFADRPRLLDAAKGFVAERRLEEDGRLRSKLEGLGIDWSSGAAQGVPRPVVTIAPPQGKLLVAGETVPWTLTVDNKGDGPLRQLRAWTNVEKDPLFDHREFVLGLVKAGEKRSFTVPLKLPRSLDSRHDEVSFHFEEENGRAPPDVVSTLDVVETAKPDFAFSTQVDDEQAGNGDGLVERGEDIALRVDVKNEGSGASGDKTYVSLKNLGDEKVFIKKGRVVIGAMKPGETKSAVLELEVKKGLKPDSMPLRVMVVDEKLDEYVSERLDIPIAPDDLAKTSASGGVKVTSAETLLLTGASSAAPPIALASRGAVFPVVARYGDFYKVEWQKGRTAFASSGEVATVHAPKAVSSATELWQHEPPRISLAVDPARGAPVVTSDKIHLEGSAVVPAGGVPGANARLRDIFVFANDKKVFFKVVPESGAPGRVEFATDVPLKPGNNAVTFFAREDEEFQARRTLYVYRRAAAQVAQGVETPPAAKP